MRLIASPVVSCLRYLATFPIVVDDDVVYCLVRAWVWVIVQWPASDLVLMCGRLSQDKCVCFSTTGPAHWMRCVNAYDCPAPDVWHIERSASVSSSESCAVCSKQWRIHTGPANRLAVAKKPPHWGRVQTGCKNKPRREWAGGVLKFSAYRPILIEDVREQLAHVVWKLEEYQLKLGTDLACGGWHRCAYLTRPDWCRHLD